VVRKPLEAAREEKRFSIRAVGAGVGVDLIAVADITEPRRSYSNPRSTHDLPSDGK
jgi:hypothetical protein